MDPSCTCEKVDLRAKVIPSGETTQLDVHYQGSNNSGKIRASVYLRTNDPDEPEMVVSLFGIVKLSTGLRGSIRGISTLGKSDKMS